MLATLLSVFKIAPFAEVSKVLQGVHFLLDTLHQDKLVNGHVSRNDAIDATIQLLENEKAAVPAASVVVQTPPVA